MEKLVEEIRNIPRESCLQSKPISSVPTSNTKEWGFISQFHTQYKEFEAIFNQHWHILLLDKKLGSVLPPKPQFIYRKAPNHGDRIVKKVLYPPTRPQSFWNQNGFFACRKCKACKEVSKTTRGLDKFSSQVNRRRKRICRAI